MRLAPPLRSFLLSAFPISVLPCGYVKEHAPGQCQEHKSSAHLSFCPNPSRHRNFTTFLQLVSLPSNENAIFISQCADFHDLRPPPLGFQHFSISVFSVCFWKFLLSAFPISAFAQCPSNENGIFQPAGPLFQKARKSVISDRKLPATVKA